MLMIVFGAGASFDSVSDFSGNDPRRMPLANELFDSRDTFRRVANSYRHCSAIIPLINGRPGGRSVEQVLEDFQAEADTKPQRRKQLAELRFYLREILM